MIFSFFRSDKPVYTTALLGPISPCQPTQAMARSVFSYLWNPHPTFSWSSRFLQMPLPMVGATRWGIHRFQVWIHSDRKLHINTLELKVVILALHHWVSGLFIYYQLVIATDNTTFAAYINKQGGTHFHTLWKFPMVGICTTNL